MSLVMRGPLLASKGELQVMEVSEVVVLVCDVVLVACFSCTIGIQCEQHIQRVEEGVKSYASIGKKS